MEIVSNAELTQNNPTEYYTLVSEQTEKAFKEGYYTGIQLGLLLSLWICVVLIFIRTRKREKQIING